MITTNRVRELLRVGKPAVGCWVHMGNADSTEILAHMGLDWIALDLEHGPWSFETAQAQLRAMADSDALPIIRVASNDPVLINRALDIGAYGIIVPDVNTREEAVRAVRACKYPPEGIRGCGPRRAALFGLQTGEYLQRANELVLVIAMIESLEAIENLPAILSVAGIDDIHVGANDLACSMGLRGDVRHPQVTAMLDRILQAGKEAGMPVGIGGMGMDECKELIEQGFQFVPLGNDAAAMIRGLRDILRRIDRP